MCRLIQDLALARRLGVEQGGGLGEQACRAAVIREISGEILRRFEDGIACHGSFARAGRGGDIHGLHCDGDALESGVCPVAQRSRLRPFEGGQPLEGFLNAFAVGEGCAKGRDDRGVFEFGLEAARIVGKLLQKCGQRFFLGGKVGPCGLHDFLG